MIQAQERRLVTLGQHVLDRKGVRTDRSWPLEVVLSVKRPEIRTPTALFADHPQLSWNLISGAFHLLTVFPHER